MVSCKKKSSVRPTGPSGSGSWTLSSKGPGYGCWAWNGSGKSTSLPPAPTETGAGRWEWDNNACWRWKQTGTGTQPTPSNPPYNNLPGTSSPDYTSSCNDQGISDSGGGSLPYYQIPAIGHGAGYPPPTCNNNLSICPVWSSSVGVLPVDQGIFTTDSRFHFRIVAKESPRIGTKDYKGIKCGYEGLPFSKIAVTVGLRRPDSNVYTASYFIKDIEVGKCSNVVEVPGIKIPVTDGPIVLDIINFKTNYSCKIYEGTKYEGIYPFCPYIDLNSSDCFELEVQFATDYTLDIPH